MITPKRGQDLGFLCRTSVESDAWLTECAPLDSVHQLVGEFEWPGLEPEEGPAMHEDEETRAWAEAARRSLSQWMDENPY